MSIQPGDKVSASVTVSGHTVKLHVKNRSRKTAFSAIRQMSSPDVTSADWIVDMGPGAGEHGGKVIATGKATTDPANKKHLLVPIQEQLPPGARRGAACGAPRHRLRRRRGPGGTQHGPARRRQHRDGSPRPPRLHAQPPAPSGSMDSPVPGCRPPVSDVGGERAARRGDTPRRLRPHTFYSARAGGSLGGGGRCRT